MTEIWRPIGGFEDVYEVSSLGRVRRIKPHSVARWGRAWPRLLKPGKSTDGYPQVNLEGQCRKVHRLVAEAFIGPRPDGMEVNHKNFDKTDARVENLEYVTKPENIRHAFGFPERIEAQPRGSEHGMHKLTEDEARDVKRRLAAGERQVDIAALYQVSQASVSSIKLGRTWRQV